MLLGWILAAGAAGLAAVAFFWGRAGRLSLGHTTAWLLLAACLLFAGVAAGVRPEIARGPSALLALLVAVAAMIVVALAHAAALTRLDERVRRLAQEVALLRAQGGSAQAQGGSMQAQDAPARAENSSAGVEGEGERAARKASDGS